MNAMPGMQDEAAEIIKQHAEMKAERANYEPVWQEIATFTDPGNAQYTTKMLSPGQRNDERVFESTAQRAIANFGAIMQSSLTPAGQNYQKVTVSDPDLAENDNVKRWLEDTTTRLFKYRNASASNFPQALGEVFKSLGGPGTGCLYTELMPGAGPRYTAIHLSEIYISQDFTGRINKVHREFEWTARQIVAKWGPQVPQQIMTAFENTPERKFTIIHAVCENNYRQPWRMDLPGMPYKSVYVSNDFRQVLGRGGYWTFPYHVTRFDTKVREVYGRSPAWEALADIKMLNEASRTMIRQAQMAAAPPLLLFDDGVLQNFSIRPDALNFGGVNESGQQLVHPLQTGASFPIAREEMEQRRRAVESSFLITLFSILAEKPNMTATEVLERAGEKAVFLQPVIGRQRSELLGPMTEREIDMLERAGALLPRPEEIQNMELRFEYDSLATRAARAPEAAGFFRTIEGIVPLMQVEPGIIRTFNSDEVVRGLAEINGVPLKWIRSKEEVAAMEEAQASQQQAQQMLAAAPVVSETALNVAKANEIQAGL